MSIVICMTCICVFVSSLTFQLSFEYRDSRSSVRSGPRSSVWGVGVAPCGVGLHGESVTSLFGAAPGGCRDGYARCRSCCSMCTAAVVCTMLHMACVDTRRATHAPTAHTRRRAGTWQYALPRAEEPVGGGPRGRCYGPVNLGLLEAAPEWVRG